MDMFSYQREAKRYAIYPEAGDRTLPALTYATLGLSNEAGEVAGKLKKVIRDADGKLTPELKRAIADELGDVLWYAALVAEELGVPLDLVAQRNLRKLDDRARRGVIGGSGDQR